MEAAISLSHTHMQLRCSYVSVSVSLVAKYCVLLFIQDFVIILLFHSMVCCYYNDILLHHSQYDELMVECAS